MSEPDICDSYIYEVASNIASRSDVTEWSLKRQCFQTIAQNYFGVLIPLLLEGNQDGKHIIYHLVLKLAPPDERYRVSGAVTVLFAREIFVYSELLHKYRELQHKLPLQYRYVTPRCYFVRKVYCKEVIAMENMCVHGFLPFTNSRFLDLDHVMVALKSLAKLHALSFILKENDYLMYTKAKNICTPLTNNSNSRYIAILIDRLTKAILKFESATYVSLLQILKSNCIFFIESAIYRVKNVCICHGDIWKENILFKYKDNVPILACIIDYQTSQISSPAYDLLYLIVSSVDSSIRQKHFNNFTDAYYEAFRQCLLNSNLDAKQIYSREDLEHDLKIIGPACLIAANTALWLSCGLQEEGHIKSKWQPVTDQEKLKAVHQYKTIIKGIIDDLNGFGYMEITELINK